MVGCGRFIYLACLCRHSLPPPSAIDRRSALSISPSVAVPFADAMGLYHGHAERLMTHVAASRKQCCSTRTIYSLHPLLFPRPSVPHFSSTPSRAWAVPEESHPPPANCGTVAATHVLPAAQPRDHRRVTLSGKYGLRWGPSPYSEPHKKDCCFATRSACRPSSRREMSEASWCLRWPDRRDTSPAASAGFPCIPKADGPTNLAKHN